MSTKTITEQALSHIAGEVAASGKRPATEVAQRIMERLEKIGLVVVPASQAGAMQVLIELDETFDLSGVESARLFLDGLRSADLPIPANRAA
ncbi:hypothetical protein AFCDBAGC_4445 [Methylobacterium cerastii]|uniref:Plasmid stabilization protein n=1 Tax=Methylobacterium cerastii TaxID=932741 RepID=A0ABQ4QMT5_9HYPH|nr:hypothetical protein [Methylobacterium cerastii]GJD46563.1 hypothetical protein AFCDBAGC_4445 [Methylobacterium cerastii]